MSCSHSIDHWSHTKYRSFHYQLCLLLLLQSVRLTHLLQIVKYPILPSMSSPWFVTNFCEAGLGDLTSSSCARKWACNRERVCLFELLTIFWPKVHCCKCSNVHPFMIFFYCDWNKITVLYITTSIPAGPTATINHSAVSTLTRIYTQLFYLPKDRSLIGAVFTWVYTVLPKGFSFSGYNLNRIHHWQPFPITPLSQALPALKYIRLNTSTHHTHHGEGPLSRRY